MKFIWKDNPLLSLFSLFQLLLAVRVIRRFLLSVPGKRVRAVPDVITALHRIESCSVSVLLPVLNEYQRLRPCLDGLCMQGEVVSEILVIDGGSWDGTQDLVRAYARRDPRIRLLHAAPVPVDWNGKAWGLHVGFRASDPASSWIITIDADVRPRPLLIRSLLAHAQHEDLQAVSVATLQEISGVGLGLFHPSLLTTLVYRFGIPGHVARDKYDVQANGQCFLLLRDPLACISDFLPVRHSLCEDITLARLLVIHGYRVGFYESDHLVSVVMYTDWREAWRNWTRSLPMHDHLAGSSTLSGWLEMMLIQALPLPLCVLLCVLRADRTLLFRLNIVLLLLRVGILCGTSRAYLRRPWSYWISPLCDVPVVLKLGLNTVRRRHVWRGRVLWRGGRE